MSRRIENSMTAARYRFWIAKRGRHMHLVPPSTLTALCGFRPRHWAFTSKRTLARIERAPLCAPCGFKALA